MSPPARSRRGTSSAGRISPGEHLRAEMERLGLNQVTLGKALGLTRQTVNNVMNGRQPVSRAMSAALGRLTHRPADYWLQNSFGAGGSQAAQKLLLKDDILEAIEEGVLGLVPFGKQRLRPACVELTLGKLTFISPKPQRAVQSFRLAPGRSAIAETREHLVLATDHVGHFGLTPEFARAGLAAFHQLQIEPGFNGHISVALLNVGGEDIVLRLGDPVFALEIVAIGGSPPAHSRAAGGAPPRV